MNRIDQLKRSIQPVRTALLEHRLFSEVSSMEALRVFTERHVFAVWDFMSLLKALQQHLTCTTVPWMPKGTPESRYLINEIVLGEESDVDSSGRRLSHFEMYLEAMEHAGSDTDAIRTFLWSLTEGKNMEAAFTAANVDESVRSFVNFTFNAIHGGKPHVLAAIFTFGREELIPDMFLTVVAALNEHFFGQLQPLQYYLERHIEVDGGHHSHLAMQMLEQLCGEHEERWVEAEQAAIEALRMRIELWDGILLAVRSCSTTVGSEAL
jgi:hypothetical protein